MTGTTVLFLQRNHAIAREHAVDSGIAHYLFSLVRWKDIQLLLLTLASS